MKALLKRSITAVFIVGIMTAAILSGPLSSWLLFLVVCGLCLIELFRLQIGRQMNWRGIMFIITGVFPYLAGGLLLLAPDGQSGRLTEAALMMALSVWLFIWMLLELLIPEEVPYTVLKTSLFGLFYIGFPFGVLPFMARIGGTYSGGLLFGLVVLIWVFDSAAYAVGSAIGRTKILPAVSPGKTWEGAAGGLVGSLAASLVVYEVFEVLTRIDWMVMACIVSVFGLIGDLIESSLKRQFASKDSGSLLPGHGGMLDRFDSLVFSIPFLGAYLYFFV